MPFYHRINTKTKPGKRIAKRLLDLKQALSSIPDKTLDSRLLIATWNIRDFDKPAYGERLDEAIYYIAEIISRFDIVAIQEVYKDLRGLNRVLSVLGGSWKYIVTDMAGDGRGNKERMTFLYDSRKVSFGGLAGELVLPEVTIKEGGKKKVVPAEQVWRTPYICGFRAGWSRFMLASVHILWGSSTAEPVDRVKEIENVADFLRKRTLDKTAWSQNLILLGDFNIFSTDDATFQMLLDHKFTVPEKLMEFESNAGKNRHYDQIAFRVQKDRLDQTGECGVFDFYEHVFTEDDESLYEKEMGERYKTTAKGKVKTPRQSSTYYKTHWRTHQMSDHLPMWVELKIDYSERYLQRKLKNAT